MYIPSALLESIHNEEVKHANVLIPAVTICGGLQLWCVVNASYHWGQWLTTDNVYKGRIRLSRVVGVKSILGVLANTPVSVATIKHITGTHPSLIISPQKKLDLCGGDQYNGALITEILVVIASFAIVMSARLFNWWR